MTSTAATMRSSCPSCNHSDAAAPRPAETSSQSSSRLPSQRDTDTCLPSKCRNERSVCGDIVNCLPGSLSPVVRHCCLRQVDGQVEPLPADDRTARDHVTLPVEHDDHPA